jgi:prepilin-type N-terminal cleavage/methylation domain-containing protein
MRRLAFTLIELLVVVTIIVVLLALLTPSLDRAIYQAELAVCGAQLKGIADGSTLYAMDNTRSYFYREGVYASNSSWRPQWLATPINTTTGQRIDHRTVIEGHVNMKAFTDPLAGDVVYDRGSTHEASYIDPPIVLFAGFQYTGNSGLLKVGRDWSYDGARFRVIAADADFRIGPAGSGGQQYSAHPDLSTNIMALDNKQDQAATGTTGASVYNDGGSAGGGLILQYTFSRWWSNSRNPGRGLCDYNYAFTDSSVARFNDVAEDDPRMTNVPYWASGRTTRSVSDWRYYLPVN